jgi:hypothetical protein
MITTQQRQGMGEMHWGMSATNGMAAARALTQSPEEFEPMDNLYKIVSLSLLFFDAIVKPFDRMIEEEEEELFGI